ncbi:MAG: cobyric acid synthase [Halanaerobiaceae bacterium]
MKAKTVMFQGTGSDVGKSVLTAALCRILAREGYRVSPFKSQNMSLNSAVTTSGGEIGRAQAVQAEAAMIDATVDMNPILLKPNADNNSQVIFAGKAQKNMSAKEYFSNQDLASQVIRNSLSKLLNNYQVIIIEGAGSPAEVNLRDYDLVNMSIAEMADSPVILIANIDKGGVFADIVGTLDLLKSDERERIKGIIINKFRGNIERFQTGIDFIEEFTGKPVLGVIPYFENMCLPEEDSLDEKKYNKKNYEIEILVIALPHMSNFTDFECFSSELDVHVRYVRRTGEIGYADVLIIPGSKNTIADLEYLGKTGMVEKIRELYHQGTEIIGICGGYQMLGKRIRNPYRIESNKKEIEGIGLLDVVTIMEKKKITSQVKAAVIRSLPFIYPDSLSGEEKEKTIPGKRIVLDGYEIHQGRTNLGSEADPILELTGVDSKRIVIDGAVNKDGRVWGTYLHGVFDNDHFRRIFLNKLRIKKGLSILPVNQIGIKSKREKAYNEFADFVQAHINMGLINDIIFTSYND